MSTVPPSTVSTVRATHPVPAFFRQSGSKGQVTVRLSVKAAEHRELLSLKLKQDKTYEELNQGDRISDALGGLSLGQMAVCSDLIWNRARGKFRLGDSVSIQTSGK